MADSSGKVSASLRKTLSQPLSNCKSFARVFRRVSRRQRMTKQSRGIFVPSPLDILRFEGGGWLFQ